MCVCVCVCACVCEANNPVLVALQEALCLWPNRPIDVVVSLGNGVPKSPLFRPHQKSVVETLKTVIESATSVDRDHYVMQAIAGHVSGHVSGHVAGHVAGHHTAPHRTAWGGEGEKGGGGGGDGVCGASPSAPTPLVRLGYYRFQPIDDRCDVELDETGDEKLAQLKVSLPHRKKERKRERKRRREK